MNKNQKIIAIIGIGIIFFMSLIPPWKMITEGSQIYTVQPIGYGLIFLPPTLELEQEAEEEEIIQYLINLDVTRLMVQWITILFIIAALLFITKEKVEEEEAEFEVWKD
jgi:hypothetical protein